MKILKFFAVILIILPLSGCLGDEPNDVAYVVALGFDRAEDNQNYLITIQFAKPTQISGGASEEGGKGGENIIENVLIEAPNIYAGMNIVNHVVSKKFSLYHTKLLVFSQELAYEGIGDLIETMSKSGEIRPDVYIAVSLGAANEYLSEVKPVVELNPSQYYQLTYDKNNAPGFPRCTLQNFYLVENTNCGDVAMPLAGVTKSNGSSQGNSKKQEGDNEQSENLNEENKTAPLNEGGFEYKIKNYVAGQVGVKERNKSETIGMAVFSGKQMAGVLGGIESMIYNILKGEYRGSYVTFDAGNESEIPVTVRMRQSRHPKINVDTKENKVNINLYLESDLYSLSPEYLIENNLDSFEKLAKSEIDKACTDFIKYTRDVYNSDILGIGMSAKRNFLTNDNFNKYNWREKFKNYDIIIDSDFKVRRTGFTIRKE